jgi:hypothetical protein
VYSECLPTRLNPLAERVCFSQVVTAQCKPGMLTQRGQGGHPAPLASRLHRILTHFLSNLYGI